MQNKTIVTVTMIIIFNTIENIIIIFMIMKIV